MYVVYSYANRQIQCLSRLAQKTGKPLFAELANRLTQLNFFTLAKDGPYMGASFTGVADPWLERCNGFNYMSNFYMDSYNTDFILQLLDLNLVKPGKQKMGGETSR